MSFVGNYSHSLDAKNRVFIPSKYRDELGEVFYVTRKIDPYLSIYTEDDWNAYIEKIEKLPESIASEIQDIILGGAQKCTMDSSGRVIFEDRLLKHAGITKNIVFVGVGKQIRVWSEETWLEKEANRYANSDRLRGILTEYNL